jgi:glycine oxidase
MPRSNVTSDVVIIGGGVIGLAIARELALKRVGKVMLIERSVPGREASFAAAGMLAPQAEADAADDFFRLCCRSRDLYPVFAQRLLDETGIDVELDHTGTLYCGFSKHDLEELDQRFDWQTRAGLLVEKLTAREARELEPHVSESVGGALRFPGDTQVENRRLLAALMIANERSGVSLVSNTEVTSLRIEHGKVVGVATSGGFVSSRNVVVAGGAWTSRIETGGGAPQIRIEPVRGQMICFEPDTQIARHVIYSPRGYIVPRRDGRLLAGSTTEEVGFDKSVTDIGVESIRSRAVEISPRISALPVTDSWAGLRPRAPDCLPVLGTAPETKGLFYATGHYRNGILLAPLTGELIAGLIADNVVLPELEAFAPDRFSPVTVN